METCLLIILYQKSIKYIIKVIQSKIQAIKKEIVVQTSNRGGIVSISNTRSWHLRMFNLTQEVDIMFHLTSESDRMQKSHTQNYLGI